MDRNRHELTELFHHCVQVVNEYKNGMSEKAFLEVYFQSHQVSDSSFVSVMLIDCVRHTTLLKIIVDTFAKAYEIDLPKSEENIYRVIVCMLFFRLDSCGLTYLRQLLTSAFLSQVHQFLRFLIDERHLSTIKTNCLDLYEEAYINEQIVRVVRQNRPDFSAIVHDLGNKIRECTSTRPLSEPTKPKPFNFTRPKPPVAPKKKLSQTPSVQRPECTKKTQDRSAQNSSERPSTVSRERSHKTNEIHTKSPPVDPFRANPVPKSLANKVSVRPNVASVLKESHFYRRQEDDVRRRLDNFEAGGRDAFEFLQWQRTRQKEDEEQEFNALERKKLEGKISYEEAILAKQRLVEENRLKADELKRQTRETVAIHVKEQLQREEKMKQLIDDVVSGRDNTKLAQQKLRHYKTDFVKQYKEDVKQLMKQALEEVELEMRQRMELIAQIRAIESHPIERSKPVNLASVVGHGVHDEMSIVELRERLERLKLERDKEREARRDQIIKDRQTKEKLITHAVQHLEKQRQELTNQTVVKRHRESSAPPSLHRKTSELQQLKDHLQSTRTQRLTQDARTSKPSVGVERLDSSSNRTQKRLAATLLA